MRSTLLLPALYLTLAISCKDKKSNVPSALLIKDLSLNKGALISCGPADQQLGDVSFVITGSEQSKQDFQLGLKYLHSFEYDESEKVFARIIDAEPGCAMAYWGVAMSNFHPLWAPPTGPEMEKGVKAVALARSIDNKTEKETAYIDAIGAFFDQHEKLDFKARCVNFENATEKIYSKYPDDKEAAIFYALSLDAAADLSDKTFARQKKAGEILNKLYPNNPNHPGVVHYIIHTYDFPELAQQGLHAAREYAKVAPSSAHALHMPSHIFTRLGLWDECISSNAASVYSAKCYAQASGMKGQWDEELHGLDYMMYGYLQKGDNDSAKMQWDYVKTMKVITPANAKVAYAVAAIPSRYVLENKLWSAAANLPLDTVNIKWQNFPWQKANNQFAHAMGAARTGNTAAANAALASLKILHDTLAAQKDGYKSGLVAIQVKTAEAWIRFQEGKKEEAVKLMQEAVAMEDKTEKAPVSPGEVLPTKELLGDMYIELKQWPLALETYEASMKNRPNRFNSLAGAALAAEKAGQIEKAKTYYQKLLQISQPTSTRKEIGAAKTYIKSI